MRNIITKNPLLNIIVFTVFINIPKGSNLSATDILDSMMVVMQPESCRGTFVQEIITSRNLKWVFTLDYYSEKNGKNILINYTDPLKVKDNAFLIKNNGDDIWVFFPKTHRIRKLASHAKKQKAQGSDFSYEDFSGSRNWDKNYYVRREESGERETYLLHLIRKENAETSYEIQKVYVDKRNYYPHTILYFQNGEHLKTLTFTNVINLQGHPSAQIMTMKNHISNSQTKMKILDMEYNIKFDEGFFTEPNLMK